MLHEKEKRPEWIFNAKWCEGRPWLKYNGDENVMTCTICTKYGYISSSVPSFREKYSSRENKQFKSLPVN
jgi:hypothetical protein